MVHGVRTEIGYGVQRSMQHEELAAQRIMLPPYTLPTRCPVLRRCTADAIGARAPPVPGTLSYQPTRVLRDARVQACYVIPGTDLAHGATSLLACYTMSGTDLAYLNTSLLACCAMWGSEFGHGLSRKSGMRPRPCTSLLTTLGTLRNQPMRIPVMR
eukprot:3466236-Rhodomonas_salina.1